MTLWFLYASLTVVTNANRLRYVKLSRQLCRSDVLMSTHMFVFCPVVGIMELTVISTGCNWLFTIANVSQLLCFRHWNLTMNKLLLATLVASLSIFVTTIPSTSRAAPAKAPQLKEYNNLVDCYSYAQLLDEDIKMSRLKSKARKKLDKIGFSYKDAQHKLEEDLRKAKRTTKKKNARKKLEVCQKAYL